MVCQSRVVPADAAPGFWLIDATFHCRPSGPSKAEYRGSVQAGLGVAYFFIFFWNRVRG